MVASSIEELVAAPLYTQGIEKDKEYRVHVFKGQVIDYQQKKQRIGVESDSTIRNHSTGWVYTRISVVLPEGVKEQAIKAVDALGLDFGAVDICTDLEGTPFVLEVNTAPGLEGTTLEKYIEAFKGLL